jgi:phosphatidylserine/phosphatidylglycerophosphate/cardiolipin synthase-like enzyme
VILADGVRGVVGSTNLAPDSFDSRRELAIEVRDDDVTDRLHLVAQHDWENSRPFDLTDKGLLADLEERYADSAVTLALGERHPTHK